MLESIKRNNGQIYCSWVSLNQNDWKTEHVTTMASELSKSEKYDYASKADIKEKN
jgi:hypothetical protein